VRRQLMDVLACPICKGPLDLVVEQEKDDEVTRGQLTCRTCTVTYPIEESIPNLLPPALRA
jgi:uncharacterized protein YbaR (Trm112 family)